MAAPTRFKVLREVPITPPADLAAYRAYRIARALGDLPADASDQQRAGVVAIENRRMDEEQGVAR